MNEVKGSDILEQAKKELQEEKTKDAVKRLKRALALVEKARQVYENAQRELDDLEQAIADGN